MYSMRITYRNTPFIFLNALLFCSIYANSVHRKGTVYLCVQYYSSTCTQRNEKKYATALHVIPVCVLLNITGIPFRDSVFKVHNKH